MGLWYLTLDSSFCVSILAYIDIALSIQYRACLQEPILSITLVLAACAGFKHLNIASVKI